MAHTKEPAGLPAVPERRWISPAVSEYEARPVLLPLLWPLVWIGVFVALAVVVTAAGWPLPAPHA